MKVLTIIAHLFLLSGYAFPVEAGLSLTGRSHLRPRRRGQKFVNELQDLGHSTDGGLSDLPLPEDGEFWTRLLQLSVTDPPTPRPTTGNPSVSPTPAPATGAPSGRPVSNIETLSPTRSPTTSTVTPTLTPTLSVSQAATASPTQTPYQPTPVPTTSPSNVPSRVVTPPITPSPTQLPTDPAPTLAPSQTVTASPSQTPPQLTAVPSPSPSHEPSRVITPPSTTSPTQFSTSTMDPFPTPSPSDGLFPSQEPSFLGSDPGFNLETAPPTRMFSMEPSTVSSVADVVASVALQMGAEFEDPNSYQSRALEWLQDTATGSSSRDAIVQRYALASIYYSTNSVATPYTLQVFGDISPVPGWLVSTRWLSSTHECSWYGITCDDQLRVSEIELAQNRMTGSFPPEVVLLAGSLNRLDLYENFLYNPGRQYNSFLGELTNIEYLFFGSTAFEYDGIPTEIGLLTNLIEFDCSYTLYFGELNGQVFSSLTRLEYLVLDGNAYNSSVPEEIAQLPMLENLYIQDAYLSGDLSFIEGMERNMHELWLDYNPGLGGSIPAAIGGLSDLAGFSVADCSLTGSLPTELGSLTEMTELWVTGNELTGLVPTQLGLLSRLHTFELEDNMISGTMPDQVCNLRPPFGLLQVLEADCIGEIECNCCTACFGDVQSTEPPVALIDAIIESVALRGGAEFQDPDSYQSRALAWLRTSNAGSLTSAEIVQRYALACIYFSTFGVTTSYTLQVFGNNQDTPGWLFSRGWLTDTPECNWFGLTCDPQRKVSEIELARNRLTGSFPPEVTLMAETLVRIDLYDNPIFNPGDEYNAFLGQLRSLQYLFFGSTGFQYNDGLPTEIGLLSNLIEFDCSYSWYFGELAGDVFENMPDLSYLSLGGNAYNSSVPHQIAELPMLEELYIEDAYLSGDLAFIEEMELLTTLWLDYNPGLSGSIPTAIGALTALESFSVAECSLTGPLPSEFGLLTNMEEMWLYANELTGFVPSEFGDLISLETLEIEDNLIVGTMPGEVCELRFPFGRLDILEADCISEIECACCTACFGESQPVDPIGTLIYTVSLQGGNEFEDPGSYQSEALEWLRSSSALGAYTNEEIIQRYALACIFYNTFEVATPYTDQVFGDSTNVPRWRDSTGWVSDAPECFWYGITCDYQLRVEAIDLAENHLTGNFPPEVVLLKSSLKRIDLYSNFLFNPGDQFNSFLGQLTNLEFLFFGSTAFQYDGIPTEIGLLTDLVEFDCSYTAYLGEISGDIFSNMPHLIYLDLSGLAFNSSVPEEIPLLPSLENLYLDNSLLSGDLSFVMGMPNIFELWVDYNPGLGGSIPTFIGQLTTLGSLSATECALTGSLPSELGLLTEMRHIWLSENLLTGHIPEEIGELSWLDTLELEYNEITGTMPPAICDLRTPPGLLEILQVDCNSEVECSCCTACFGPMVPTAGPTSVLQNRLVESIALLGGSEFEDPGSYQLQALRWLEDSQDDPTDQELRQRYALACIYFRTNAVRTAYTDDLYGSHASLSDWTTSSGWISDSHECTWFGITCNSQGQITAIDLAENSLTGNFPPEVAVLRDSLIRIDLYDNDIYNPGPAYNSFLGLLTNLEYLYLGGTGFQYDGIPPELSQLERLLELDISQTFYFGELDGSIFANLERLIYLDLGANLYSGSVPAEIGNLPRLENLYLDGSHITGDLSFMKNMNHLVELWINSNPALGGRLPTWIGQLSTVQSLSLGECSFTGTIPSEFGNLSNLETLWLFNNQLTGTLSTELGRLDALELLEVEFNDITGSMPAELCLLREPIGLLEVLEADCAGVYPDLYCTCCTACF